MKFSHFVLSALLGHSLASHDHHHRAHHRTAGGRFSALERRERRYTAPAELLRRDDYTCGPGKPCSNGACCGASGWCGYGSTYCGDGCTSNCDAHAECGKDALPANKTCPLNTCCSEFGFCGTTTDFCTGNCQSHCVEHPKPPGGASAGNALSKVIGYYEAWNDVSKCHPTAATDIPADALTHLNYAFAYIHPTSFEITTMDAATPVRVFQDVADLKLRNPNLELFVSLGGWTFSDNGTTTQPVFGNIASSAANRQTFATNVLKFLNTYGYDGVDIDWEYPGASDRGGTTADTKNYVLLLQTLRSTFDGSGRKLGITFTAPSSFWYLRWFDLPSMVKYADWINLMSYDLHGVWDGNNPIGSIVQGHTNLTEIKLAVELFWRVNIPPSKIALGFGFYGRAFTLADPNCNTPGCPFSGGAKAGVCTATSGYLAHYEIQDIMSKNKKRGLTPVYDKAAAVKYMTWDNDQWISFDDADTFADKIKWANGVGFSGSLIWASDLDDYDLTAHKALTNKTNIGKRNVTIPIDQVDASLGHNCYVEGSQFRQMCDAGYVKVGADRDGIDCSGTPDSLCGRIICCPKTSGMTDCMWRGGGKDCNGRCHDGEVKVTTSSWGGTPGESSATSKCNRGTKAFCCKAALFDSLTADCHWNDHCGDSCADDEESVAHAYDRWGWATVFCNGYNYCCKKNKPMPLTNCHWVGQGDCADNTCAASEVTLWTNERGDSYSGCAWYREKSLCCTPNADNLEEEICDYDPCDYDASICSDGLADVPGAADSDMRRRTYIDEEDELEYEFLEARAGSNTNRPGLPRQISLQMLTKTVSWNSRPYPPGNKRNYLFRQSSGFAAMLLQGGYQKASQVCTDATLVFKSVQNLAKTGFQTEHFYEVQFPKKLLETAFTGVLPRGGIGVSQLIKSTPLTEDNIAAGWNKLYAAGTALNGYFDSVVGATYVPSSYVPPVNSPSDRLMTVLGDYGNMQNLLLIEGNVNWVKGKLFSLENPMAQKTLEDAVKKALSGDAKAAKAIEAVLQNVFAVFKYLNDAGAETLARSSFAAIQQEITNMDSHMPELKGIKDIFDEFWPAYHQAVSDKAILFVCDAAAYVASKMPATPAAGSHLASLAYTATYFGNKAADTLQWQTTNTVQ